MRCGLGYANCPAHFSRLTGLLLIWDLEHPARFYMIFTRPQWRSWLVKGAFVIAGYSAVLAVHFLSSLPVQLQFSTN
jgi:formate-dependent nitrite reductase membrane component NrfD